MISSNDLISGSFYCCSRGKALGTLCALYEGLCARYRYDELRRERLKTVELVVEKRPWQPPFRFRDEDLVPLSVGFDETALREKLRKLRGKWDPAGKVWLLPYGKVRGTELEARIPADFMNGRSKR